MRSQQNNNYATTDTCIACPVTATDASVDGVAGKKELILHRKIGFHVMLIKDFHIEPWKICSDAGKFWLLSKFTKYCISTERFFVILVTSFGQINLTLGIKTE